ncbi:MAG: DUF4197 family protein [Gammaproteobacteria bacterium]
MQCSLLARVRYVTGKTQDGLFQYIAMVEKRICDNPAARIGDLLRQVFGD